MRALEWVQRPVEVGVYGAAAMVAVVGFCAPRRRRGFDGRAYALACGAEVAGLWLVLAGCTRAGRTDLLLPLIGVVVGLHFLLLVRAFRDRSFAVVAVGMVGASALALPCRLPLREAVAGLGCGATLWGYALWTGLARRLAADDR